MKLKGATLEKALLRGSDWESDRCGLNFDTVT